MAAPLTPKQGEIYDFILQYTRSHGYPPVSYTHLTLPTIA